MFLFLYILFAEYVISLAQVSLISKNLQYFISAEAPTKRCSGKEMFWSLQSKSFKDNNEDVLI